MVSYGALFDAQDRLIDDPELKHTLTLMKWGKSISARDVYSLNSYLERRHGSCV